MVKTPERRIMQGSYRIRIIRRYIKSSDQG